jgi:hypothetical protein
MQVRASDPSDRYLRDRDVLGGRNRMRRLEVLHVSVFLRRRRLSTICSPRPRRLAFRQPAGDAAAPRAAANTTCGTERTSESVVRLERVGIAQVPRVIDDNEVANQAQTVHRQCKGPVPVRIVGNAQTLQHPVRRVRPEGPQHCAGTHGTVRQRSARLGVPKGARGRTADRFRLPRARSGAPGPRHGAAGRAAHRTS